MVLKLYGWFGSTPALLSALVLYEKNIDFEWIEVDLTKNEQKSPVILEKHPFGQVPFIEEEDGFVLYESRAIVRYLEEKYPDQGVRLISKDPRKSALVNQATWVELNSFSRYGSAILWETLNKKHFKLETNAGTVEEAKKNLFAKLDIYEKILSKSKYIAGDELSLADLAHVPVASRLLEEAGIELGKGRPHVEKWLNELISRESWKKVKAKHLTRPSPDLTPA